jgi:predicted kinase
MWDHLPVSNLINLQRAAAWKTMGEEARRLLAEGYPVDADRVLDEMAERRRAWRAEAGLDEAA